MRARRRTSTADGGAGVPYVDAARLARLVTPAPRHSGAPDITVSQWAILARCRMSHWVPVEDIMRSAIDWFTPPLSIGEVVHAIGVLAGQGWMLAGVFRLTGKDSIPQGLGDEGGLQSLPKPGSGGRHGNRRPPDDRPDRR